MSGYIGNILVPQATQTRDSFIATAGQTSFPTSGYTPNFLDVYLNGIKLHSSDFTATNGSDVVLTTGAAVNDVIDVVAYNAFDVASGTFDDLTVNNNIAVSGTVDGRDIAADGTKLDGIESGATGDQTNAEIRAAVEAATDSNVFTDADHTKLNAIEASATADQTAAEIRTLVESATDSNVFTDADHTKLNAIEANATADQTKSDIDALNINADTLDGQHGSYYTGYADTAVANIVDSAPGTLDTLNELAAALGDDPNFATTVTNSIATKLPLAGGTLTGNLSFGDDDKAIFGNSSDLQIFHQSSNGNSIIKETGGGILSLQTNGSEASIFDITNNAHMARFITGGKVQLNYNGNNRIETTSSGISVTGSVAVSGTVDGRDVASDGTKLDGIESGATADQTKADIDALNINAHTLDGRQGYQYVFDGLDNGTTDIIVNDADFIVRDTTDGTTNFLWRDHSANKLYLGTVNAQPTTRYDLYTQGGSKYYHAGNDGSGSGLDADLLDGQQASAFLLKTGGTITGDTSINNARLTITDDTDALRLYSTNNGVGVNIKMSDNAGQSQNGTIKYVHADGSSYGSGNAFIFESTEASMTFLADGKLMYKEGIYSKPASGTGAGTRKDANWDTAYTTANAALPKAGGTVTGNIDITGTNAIRHSGDTNTYMQFHAADQWRVVTGGAERLEVNNSQITSTEPIHAPSFHGDGSALTGVGGSTAFNAVGTYTWLTVDVAQSAFMINEGDTISSAYLKAAHDGQMSAHHFIWSSAVSAGVSGTWRLMGGQHKRQNSTYSTANLFVRIS